MATLPVSDQGQKKKRIITLALMAIFLMSASFFLIDRKDETRSEERRVGKECRL